MSLAEPTAPTLDIARRAVRGTAWTLPTSLASRAVGLVGTLLLARYLSPAEYGEVSAAAIVMLSASSITTFGVGMYLVANRHLSRDEVFHATCWFLAVGVTALAITWELSGPLGDWTGAPALARFLPIFIATMLLERIVFIPERMLVRELRFKRLGFARAAGELAYTGVTVGLASVGIGPASLAWGTLARATVRFIAIVPAVSLRDWLEPHRLRRQTMMKIVSYGMKVSSAGIASFAMRRWDNLLVGRYFGAAAMGAYNYAYNLADTPAVSVGEQMSDVVGASFPHVNERSRGPAVVRACRLLALIMFPLAFGLGVVAPTIVETFFNPKWANVGVMLVFLSVLSAVRPIADTILAYLYASQRPTLVLLLEWLSLAGILLGIMTIGRFSIQLTCVAVGIVFILRMLAAMFVVQLRDGVPITKFLSGLWGQFLASAIMVAAVILAKAPLQPFAPAARLTTEVAIGGIVYGCATFVVARPLTTEMLGLLRSTVFRRGGEPQPAIGRT